MKVWLSVALRRDIVVRGLKVGVIVGTILVAINQGDMILSGQLDASAAWKIPLTYLVPYCVSTYGGVSAIRAYDKGKSSS
ncbi:MAG: nitrate/nitrite transporter NrtS [Proteobacteria bacterium]|nr:nitrate/nitrite transporter NrtS [Pseudomonadota bacterium]TDJ33706.1 MAG: phosphoenolpyruvate protein kinase [Gammaproteobacteria bacterium]